METPGLTVEKTEQRVNLTMQEREEAAIAEAADTEIVTAALATEPALPAPQTSTLPTMAGLWQLTLGWQPDEQQQAQFQQLYAFILAGNHQFNLTRITEPTEFWEKHLWDSLVGVKAFLQATEDKVSSPFKVIDIGTGAGFPGVPVAIAQPTWAVTLLDSTRKKMTFLDQVLSSMGLANAITLAERVEQVGRQKHQRQTYDLALIRAVAATTVCAEYALPLVKQGGAAVLYRGQWTTVEMNALEEAVAQLGGAIDAIESFTTPLTHSVRHCIVLKKVAPTPTAFPRAVGVPTQSPL